MLYDLNGNRLGKTGQRMGVEGKQEMSTVFCYDSMNRLTMENRREGGEKYAYDLGKNRFLFSFNWAENIPFGILIFCTEYSVRNIIILFRNTLYHGISLFYFGIILHNLINCVTI